MNQLNVQFAAVVAKLTTKGLIAPKRGRQLRSEALRLLAEGADPDLVLPTGETCLFCLVRGLSGNTENIDLVCEVVKRASNYSTLCPVAISRSRSVMMSVLEYAVQEVSVAQAAEFLRAMIEAGADFNQKNSIGATILDLVLTQGIELLQSVDQQSGGAEAFPLNMHLYVDMHLSRLWQLIRSVESGNGRVAHFTPEQQNEIMLELRTLSEDSRDAVRAATSKSELEREEGALC